MKYATLRAKATLSALLLLGIVTAHAYALDTGVYLDASASAASVQDIDTSLDLKADTITHVEGAYQLEAQEKSSTTQPETTTSSPQSTPWEKAWLYGDADTATSASPFLFLKHLFAVLTFNVDFGTEEASSTQGILQSLVVRDVGSDKATIDWSPTVLEDATVYYGTTTSLAMAEAAVHEPSWKFWKRSQITLEGLTPNTTYLFKVVGSTGTGTTTAASSFTTLPH